MKQICRAFGEEFPTLADAWKKYGKVNKYTFYNRWNWSSMSLEDCLTRPIDTSKIKAFMSMPVTAFGKRYPSAGDAYRACCKVPICVDAFRQRLRRLEGRTVEQACTLSPKEWREELDRVRNG